jgi:DNA invertase Pin-like site-specific DNA recombinase
MRASTSEQNLALQRDALEGAGCERLYEDTCRGSPRMGAVMEPRQITERTTPRRGNTGPRPGSVVI